MHDAEIRVKTKVDVSELKKVKEEIKASGEQAEKTDFDIQKFAMRMSKLALKIGIVVGLIGKGVHAIVSGLKTGLQNLAKYGGSYNDAMSNLKSATLTMSNALATAFAPIVETIIPYLVKLADWVTIAADKIAQFFAVLSGNSSYTKATKQNVDYAKSLEKVNKQLAGFDELNNMSSNGEQNNPEGMFEEVAVDESKFKWLTWLKDTLKEIEGLGATILGLFLGWKVTSAFFGGLSKVSIACGLIVGGIVAIIEAIKQWVDTGEITNQYLIMLESGIVAIGIAISLLTGNFIPLIISAVVGLVTLIVAKWDEIVAWLKKAWEKVSSYVKSHWNSFVTDVKRGLNHFKEFFVGIFNSIKDGVLNAFNGIWNGIKKVINWILGGIEGMINGVIKGINFLIDKLNGFGFDLPDILGGGHVGFTIRNLEEISMPRLATGGIVDRPTTALIGENGREAVMPLENNTEWMDALADKLASKINGAFEVVPNSKGIFNVVRKEAQAFTRNTGSPAFF